MRFASFMTAVSLVAGLLSGCAGAAENEGEATTEASDELAASRYAEQLMGAWTGPSVGSNTFTGLVFTRTPEGTGRHFFGDLDTGIRCITTPCPSSVRIEGRYSVTARNLTISHPDRPSAETAPLYGRYQYRLSGDTLILTRYGREAARLQRVRSYCGSPDDCHEQNLIVPRCLGAFQCEANACVYRCGPRPGSEGGTCGGIAGIACDAGLSCVLEATFPDAAGRCYRRPTCADVTCAPGYFCTEGDGVRCLSGCARVRCASGTTCVSDADGTRCEPNRTGPACGPTTCAEGMVCCNPLRGICTRPGEFCIQ